MQQVRNRIGRVLRDALLAGIAAVAIAAAPAAASDFVEGDVIEGIGYPVDGDSLDVGEKRIPVRLFGISAPEYDAPLGPFATRVLHEFAYGKDFRCIVIDVDKYKRPVAECFRRGGDLLNTYLLGAGAATVYRRFLFKDRDAKTVEAYLAAEKAACAERRGIWRDRPAGICGN